MRAKEITCPEDECSWGTVVAGNTDDPELIQIATEAAAEEYVGHYQRTHIPNPFIKFL